MQQANYLNTLVCACAADNGMAQDAIEHAVIVGWITPTYDNLDADMRLVMTHYDEIIGRFQRVVAERQAELLAAYAPLINEILRPVPLSTT